MLDSMLVEAFDLRALCALGACCCVLRAAWIFRFYHPARINLIGDGYRDARRERDEAIFLGECAPMPFTVEDEIDFTASDGRAIRMTVRRWAKPRGASPLIWHAPNNPYHISTGGPFGWLGLAAFALSMLLLFQ